MTGTYEQLDLASVRPADDNPRKDLGDLDELAASIRSVGLLEPLVVCPNGEGFTVVAGARRAAAAKLAGLDSVPVIIREFDDRGRREAMLVENLARKDLTPLEEANGYRGLLELGCKQKEIAARIGVSPSHVSKRLALLVLPTKAQEALSAGKLTVEDTLELVRLKDHPDRIEQIVKRDAHVYREDMRYIVDRQLRAAMDERVETEAKQRAVSEGIKLVPYPNYSSKARCLGKDRDELPLTKAQHKKEPCHAAALTPGYAYQGGARKFVYVCTDPSRHTKSGESPLMLPRDVQKAVAPPKETTAQRRERLRREALVDARRTRKAFIAKLVVELRGRKVSKDAILDVVCSALGPGGLTSDEVWEAQEEAAIALGLAKPAEDGDVGPDAEADDLLAAFIREGGSPARHKVGLAVALCGAEGKFGDLPPRWALDFLTKHGHELSEVEQQALADAGKDGA